MPWFVGQVRSSIGQSLNASDGTVFVCVFHISFMSDALLGGALVIVNCDSIAGRLSGNPQSQQSESQEAAGSAAWQGQVPTARCWP